MKFLGQHYDSRLLGISLILSLALPVTALATKPCGDFGECKALVEINSSDGDIGFHFLMDGNDLNSAMLIDPDDEVIFAYMVDGPLLDQKLTETFAESAEPLCFDPALDDDDENDDEHFVTIEEFLSRWTPGVYTFSGLSDEDEVSEGASLLTFELPAAPEDLEYDDGVISWSPGEDLGECADAEALDALVPAMLPVHPEDVGVYAWEVVLEPDVEDESPLSGKKFTVRIPGDAELLEVSVPEDYLAALPDNTPAKIEVGAIGADDNATFSEEGEVCLNEVRDKVMSRSPYQFILYPFSKFRFVEGGCDFEED
ncbi:MAG: hypothetical protein HKO64_08955 [Xanthomonadales bacterium]|nr:hypothetical protein [Xanthomonadales bacterium]NNL95735.1 hypothetical protein [Xanthomonadales bacterium]